MNDTQILTIAFASVPTMLTVLIGVLLNNARMHMHHGFRQCRTVPPDISEMPGGS